MKCLLSRFGSFCFLFTALLSSSKAATLLVTNTADAGPGTLRQAITDANSTSGADFIHFNIAPGGPQFIYLTDPLPELAGSVAIDGTTQPLPSGGAIIHLYPPADTDGLVFAGTNCVVRGVTIIGGRNSVVLRQTSREIVLGGTNYQAEQSINQFLSATEAGFRIEGGWDHVIQGTQAYNCGGAGLIILGGSNCVVRGNVINNNNGSGISIEGGVKGVLQGNTITDNSVVGVAVLAGNNHSIQANSIHRNRGLGIDLGGDGATANDNDDPDTGPNQLQNFPIINTATFSASGLAISGSLNSRPNTTFTLDFYANVACDESGNGEGQQYLGSASITTANNGDRNFNVTLTNVPVGRYVTVTATDPAGNTSEFSPCVRFASTIAPATFTVTNVNDAGLGSLRQAILNSNARFASGPNTITFNIPGSGVHRILLTSDPLPQIAESVIIDGYTQPGSSVNTASNAFNGVVRIRLDGVLLVSGGTYCRALDITAGSSTVRGLNIMNFAYAAVACSGEGSNTISGNLIGITTDGEVGPTGGSSSVGSFEASVVLTSSSHNLIGGTNAAGRNVVAGSGHGDLGLSGSMSNRVLGNFFGCDTTGTNGISGGGYGVNIDGSTGNVIGGTNSLLRNVFLGHGGTDAYVVNGSLRNVFQGNHLGIGADGIPHDDGGMILSGECHDTLIGGTNSGSGNLISGTVYIYDGTGNAFLRNSVVNGSNGGIDLGQNGPTPNDPDDSDTGANNLQNYPEILSAIRYPNRTVIRSHLQSIPHATYRIDFYDNDRPPPSGFTEAQTWIGTTNVTLGGSGQSTFNWSPVATLTPGHWVTATATDSANNTSELAPAAVVALSNAVNLAVTLAAPTEPVSRTSNFTYTVEVRNLGPTNATGVILTNVLPANVSFVSASTTHGSCTHAAGTVTCSLGGLTNGGLASVTMTVQPLTNGFVEFTARVGAAQPESHVPDNMATGGQFAGLADVDVLAGSFTPDPVTAGQTYDTFVAITNRGPDPAFVRVEVTWTWPDTAVSITTPLGTVPVSSSAAFGVADIGPLPAGGSSAITVRSLNTDGESGRVFIRVISDGSDPDSEDYFSGSPAVVPGPGVLTLEYPIQWANESDSAASLRVLRYSEAVGTVTVSYTTSPGSATAGVDYVPVSGTLTFADGETEKFISVPVLEDFQAECAESFNVSLFNPTGGASFLLFGNTNSVVQILDNDPSLRGVVAGVSATATNASAAGSGGSESMSVSDNGRYVAFASSALDLVSADINGPSQVFVRDLMTGRTTLASVSQSGTNSANDGANQPQLSPDGRYLAFASRASDLVTNEVTVGYQQVFLRDLQAGITRLVSQSQAGLPAVDGDAENPLITSNGLGVAFGAYSLDKPGIVDVNSNRDVYFRDAAAGVTHLVSVNRWGNATGNGESFLPVGYPGNHAHARYLGFNSRATDLVAGEEFNEDTDVFVRDLTNGVTTLVSVNRFGTGTGNGGSSDPLVSSDGRFVLFYSSSSDLIAEDTGGIGNIFVRDLVAGVTRLVSMNRFGTGGGNETSYHLGLSLDGRHALFLSDASNLVENDNNGSTDVFVRDLIAGTTVLVSRNCDGRGPGNGRSDYASISPDGRYVAFTSDATDLLQGAGGGGHAYLRDLVTGTTTLLTGNWRGGVSPWGGCFGTAVANGAATVAFLSVADDLLPIDQNGSQDVFAWHMLASNTVDLVVEQVDSPDPVWPGSNLTYTVTVLNRGLTNASDVQLADTLPAGATFISASPSQGSCSQAAGLVTCLLGSINADSLATVAITVVLPSSGQATNLATATSANVEAYAANNTKAETTALLALTDLSVGMTGGPDYVIPGQTVNFVVTITNRGPQDAGGVVVTSTLLPYVSINSATASQGTVAVVGSEVRTSLGALGVNESATLELVVQTHTLADFGHETRVSFAGDDTNPLNNTDYKSIAVRTNLGWMVLSPFEVAVPEGCAAVFTVTRTGQTNGAVSIDYETSNSDALAGIDYVAQFGTLSFADGEVMKTIQIQTLPDLVDDSGEYLRVDLRNPGGGAAIGWPFSYGHARIQPPPLPALTISRSGSQVLIATWPCAPTNCVLEGATNLPAGNTWTAVPATVIDNGQTRSFIVTNDMPFRILRLRCP
jgi:uncharacterized repeat protein (TIGR01451 family)